MSKYGLNKVMLIGNVGRDPESKFIRDDMPLAKFSVATAEYKKNSDNGHTEWHNIVTFGKTASFVTEYVKKGDSLYIEGKVRTRSWETDSGEKRYSTEIIADNVNLLSSKNKSGGSGGGGSKKRAEFSESDYADCM